MPPRKNVRRPAPQNRRKPSPRKNQKQLSAGILFIFVPLLLVCGYLMLRSGGSTDKPTVQPAKATIEQKQEHNKDLDTLSPPPAPFVDSTPKEQKPEQPQPDQNQADNPEVTGKDQTPPAPEPKEVEKPIETISALNAVKLFMFDRGLNQNNITQSGNDIAIKTSSGKQAAELKSGLKAYLRQNKLEITSSKPLTVKDSKSEYTISFNVEKPAAPKPAPEVKKPEPQKQTPPHATKKPASKPQSKPAPVQPPKPAIQTPKPPKAVKPAPVSTAPATPVSFKAKLALVIDDCGYNTDLAQKATHMGYPVTLAVIPYTPNAVETARIAKASGNTLFLHLPMQPKSYPSFDPGKGALLLSMPEQIIGSVIRADVDALGVSVDGANNHTGSAFTEDEGKMTQALTYLKGFTGRFLDSRTSGGSKAYSACQKLGMKCGANSLFLDNENASLSTGGDKSNHVHEELITAAKMALSRGSVIVIGHLRKDTVAAFPAALAEVQKMGVKVVPVTQLMY